MATQATIGHGSKFQYGDNGTPEVFTDFAEVVNITPSNFVRDVVDATHMASPFKYREFIGGLRDPGECSVTMNFIPGGIGQDQIFLQFNADVMSTYRVVYPNSEIWEFDAWCVGFAPEDPLDGKMSATARFKLSGKPTFFST